jgi:Protein of unknown function (DUF2961)
VLLQPRRARPQRGLNGWPSAARRWRFSPRRGRDIVFDDPARIDSALDSRSISFENPTGERGAGGAAANGRKGSPSRLIGAGETVTLADIKGPGRLRHLWMTFPPGPPAQMRSLVLQVFYDGLEEPSIAVPCLDFFGLPHGRPAAYSSALTSVAEGRGFNAYFPMPFRKRLRMDIVNASPVPISFFYQIDYTLGDVPADAGYLHVSFRRENPTTERRDFVIAGGFKGPGRFLGCVVVQVLPGWRSHASDDLRNRPRGLCGQCLGHGATHLTVCGCPGSSRASCIQATAAWPGPGVRQLLPLACA